MGTGGTGAELIGRRIGSYEIAEEIGSGGMATVYRAIQRSVDREVALKVLSPFLVEQEGFLERFQREAKIVARLDHPNILPLFDFATENGWTYLSMPLVRGGTLRQRLNNGRIRPQLARRVLQDTGSALDHAHQAGVVHRDIKPSNVLLHADGRCLLADFGLAYSMKTSARLTYVGLTLGTPGYMSPEQANGEQIDERADVWALGVIAYELLTGSIPFKGASHLETMALTVREPYPPASLRNPSLPAEVDRVLERLLAKDPAARPATIREATDALMGLSLWDRASAPPPVPADQVTSSPPPPKPFPQWNPQPTPSLYSPATGSVTPTNSPTPHTPTPHNPGPQSGNGQPSNPFANQSGNPYATHPNTPNPYLTNPPGYGSQPGPATAAGYATPLTPLPPAGPISPAVPATPSGQISYGTPPPSMESRGAILPRIGVRRLVGRQPYFRNSYFANLISSARESSGAAWPELVRALAMPELLHRDPIRSEDLSTPLPYLARLHNAYEAVFGPAAPARIRDWAFLAADRWATRSGRKGLRGMLGRKALQKVLADFAAEQDEIRGEHLHTTRQLDVNEQWVIHFSNAFAMGRRTHLESCHFLVATYEAELGRAGLLNQWRVEEIECGAVTGQGDCIFAVRSLRRAKR